MPTPKVKDGRCNNTGRRGIPPERCGISEETTLETCLRRYKNDSLIAYHLCIPVEEVRKARETWKPPTMRGLYLSDTSPFDIREYTNRAKEAEKSNAAYLEALTRRGARG
jgi:hypothetical protein